MQLRYLILVIVGAAIFSAAIAFGALWMCLNF